MAKRMSTTDRRAQLLAAGKRVFAERAFDQVSTDELAAFTGTSKGLLYHYFGNKRGFYLATISASADDLLEVTRFDENLGGVPASIDGFVSFVAREGGLFRAVVRGGIGSDTEVDALIGRVREELVARIVGVLAVKEVPPTLRAQIWGWLGFAEGLAIHWVEKRPFDEATLRRLLVQGFTTLILTYRDPED
jgi:AcrR family transcriptional regulator